MRSSSPAAPVQPEGPPRWVARLARPIFLVDEARERFRDDLMRWWRRHRGRVLDEARRHVAAGRLDDPADAFFLRSGDLDEDPAPWRDRAAAHRAAWERAAGLDPPTTASRSAIEAAAREAGPTRQVSGRPAVFTGISLGRHEVVGRAVRAPRTSAPTHRTTDPEPRRDRTRA